MSAYDIEITPAERWCQEQFNNYDNASEALELLNVAPKTSILWTAKLKRAQRLLEMADAKANAAEFVRILMKDTPTGEIYMNVPYAEIKAHVRW